VPLPVFVIAGVAALAVAGGTTVAVASAGETAVVQRVVDGDTFDAVSDGRSIRVRLLNVDTPETKDPSKPVECLGAEATARLEQLLPEGSAVTLDRDGETVDGYDRQLAGVTNADGVFVNEQLARDGLGVPMLVGGNDRFHGDIVAANQEARAQRRGLYASDVTCTLPAQVGAVEAAPGTLTPIAVTPEQYDAAAGQADTAATGARALLAAFDGPRVGMIWSAFTRSEQDAFRRRVQSVIDNSSRSASTSRSTARSMRERAAAEQRAQEEAVRQEAARQERERQQAAAEARARDRADAEARAEARRRAAASSDDSSTRANRSSGSSASGGASSGYNGPRCYAPGGRTWRPC
jgi:micrococcal nuclease